MYMQARSKHSLSNPATYAWLRSTKINPTAALFTLNNEIMSSNILYIVIPIFIDYSGVLKLRKAIINPTCCPDSKAFIWVMKISGLRP